MHSECIIEAYEQERSLSDTYRGAPLNPGGRRVSCAGADGPSTVGQDDAPIYFWRTAIGSEVDFLVERQDGFVPVEAKAGATPQPGMASAILACQADLAKKTLPGYVVHGGDIRLPLGPRVTAVPLGAF